MQLTIAAFLALVAFDQKTAVFKSQRRAAIFPALRQLVASNQRRRTRDILVKLAVDEKKRRRATRHKQSIMTRRFEYDCRLYGESRSERDCLKLQKTVLLFFISFTQLAHTSWPVDECIKLNVPLNANTPKISWSAATKNGATKTSVCKFRRHRHRHCKHGASSNVCLRIDAYCRSTKRNNEAENRADDRISRM